MRRRKPPAKMHSFDIRAFQKPAFWIPPVTAFLVSRTVASIAAYFAGVSPFVADSWVRWDSGHYLSIAQKGYEFVSCKSIGFTSTSEWCGNTGWFPAYSGLVRGLSYLLGNPSRAGVLLSAVFFVLALAILWNLINGKLNSLSSWMTLLCAALFPGTIYSHAVFPISMTQFLIFVLIGSVSFEKNRIAMACAWGAACAYSTGFLAGGAVAAFAFFQWIRGKWDGSKFLRGIGVAGFSALGFIGVMALQRLSTGVAWTFFKAHAKYEHTKSIPFQGIFDAAAALLGIGGVDWPKVINQETIVLVGLMLLSLGQLAWATKRRKDISDLQILAVVVAFPYFLINYGLSALSTYRGDALLLPLILILNRWSLLAKIAAFAVFVYLAFGIDRLFFEKYLV